MFWQRKLGQVSVTVLSSVYDFAEERRLYCFCKESQDVFQCMLGIVPCITIFKNESDSVLTKKVRTCISAQHCHLYNHIQK